MNCKIVCLGIAILFLLPLAMAFTPETAYNNYLRNSSLVQSISLSGPTLSYVYDGNYKTGIQEYIYWHSPNPGWINVTFTESVTIGAFRLSGRYQAFYPGVKDDNVTFYHCDNSTMIGDSYQTPYTNLPYKWQNFTPFTVSKVCIQLYADGNIFAIGELQLYDQQYNDLNSLPLTANFGYAFSSAYKSNAEKTSLKYIYLGEVLSSIVVQFNPYWDSMWDGANIGDPLFPIYNLDPQDAGIRDENRMEQLNFSVYAVDSSNVSYLVGQNKYQYDGTPTYSNATINLSQLPVGDYHFKIYSFDNHSMNSSIDSYYNFSVVAVNYTGMHILRTESMIATKTVSGVMTDYSNCVSNCVRIPSNYYGPNSYADNYALVMPKPGWGGIQIGWGNDVQSASLTFKTKDNYIPQYILTDRGNHGNSNANSWLIEASYDSTNGTDGYFFRVFKNDSFIRGNASVPPARWYRINASYTWPDNFVAAFSYAPVGTYSTDYGYLHPGNITYPNGGEVFDKNLNQTVNITWSAADASEGLTNYLVYYSNDSVWTLIATVSNTTLNYVWNISNVSVSLTHRIKVVSNDSWGAQYSDTSNAVFAIMSPAVISNVQCTDVVPNAGTSALMSITYDVQSELGVSNLNQSAARIFSPVHDAVCSGTNVSAIKMSYSCNVTIWHWYEPKIYTANVSIYDRYYQTTYYGNVSDCEVYALLASQVYPSYLYFYNAVPGVNNTPVQESIKINNTGNVNLTNITVKAYNLQGDTWPPITLPVSIFKVNYINDSSSALNLTHNVTVSINSSVAAGNNSYIQLYFWASIPQDQQPQTYSTTTPWEIQVNN